MTNRNVRKEHKEEESRKNTDGLEGTFKKHHNERSEGGPAYNLNLIWDGPQGGGGGGEGTIGGKEGCFSRYADLQKWEVWKGEKGA